MKIYIIIIQSYLILLTCELREHNLCFLLWNKIQKDFPTPHKVLVSLRHLSHQTLPGRYTWEFKAWKLEPAKVTVQMAFLMHLCLGGADHQHHLVQQSSLSENVVKPRYHLEKKDAIFSWKTHQSPCTQALIWYKQKVRPTEAKLRLQVSPHSLFCPVQLDLKQNGNMATVLSPKSLTSMEN